jgi:hypothetical protein
MCGWTDVLLVVDGGSWSDGSVMLGLSSVKSCVGRAGIIGTQVGDMGKTGCSIGAHLHVRVRLNGLDRNPMDVIAK